MGIDADRVSRPRAVFLDRDGVLNHAIVRKGKPYHPRSVDETILIEGARESLDQLKQKGFLLLVVTNQPDVGRGTTTREQIEQIHGFLAAKLPIDDFFICYHDDPDACGCRKPAPGLLHEAEAKYGLDLQGSYLIGDRWRDIDAGSTAGCRTVFIDYGYKERGPAALPDFTSSSLDEAVDWILRQENASKEHC
jgi:D-glycero-D-manno-heptose 1,7-bisphosphate phosphatase